MAKATTSRNAFFNQSKLSGDFRFPGFDARAITESQRRNLEALTDASQLVIEGAGALVRRQGEIVRKIAEEMPAMLRDWAQSGTPEDRLAKCVEAAKLAFEKVLANARELNDIGNKASAEVFGVIARRVNEGLDELRLYAKKQAAAE
jgi:phasin family protein